mgnify:CR=1 FL=1|jgi:hypothetical protein
MGVRHGKRPLCENIEAMGMLFLGGVLAGLLAGLAVFAAGVATTLIPVAY